jgi:RNA polymerase-interacting CarD/CdnL/TRCF family regulator
MKDQKIKVGDKIIKGNKVYIIFKIKVKKIAGKLETVVFFKPYFKSKYNKDITVSVPFANFEKANIRLPMTKKNLKKLLTELSHKSEVNLPIEVIAAKEALNSNDPYKNIEVLKRLVISKKDKTINFTQSKKDVFIQVLSQLVEEIAFVGKLSLVQTEKKIQKILKSKI